jgi:hypothetical protein
MSVKKTKGNTMQKNIRTKGKHSFNEGGFRQTHSGRAQFSNGEWGSSSEFRDRDQYVESDSYKRLNEKSTFRDEGDDESFNREYNRSRFAEPYNGGQFARSQYGIGRPYHSDQVDHSSPGYGAALPNFSGVGPKGYVRSDDKIYDEVCEVLFTNPFVDASDIDVKVANGIVTLSGTVENRSAKKEAERSTENILGVIDIKNDLIMIEHGVQFKNLRSQQ